MIQYVEQERTWIVESKRVRCRSNSEGEERGETNLVGMDLVNHLEIDLMDCALRESQVELREGGRER